MQFSKTLTVFFCAAIQVAFAAPKGEYNNGNDTTGAVCTPVQQAVPLYRLYHQSITNHFYTADAAEADHAVNVLGYQREGTTGLVFSTQVPGTVPLHRLYNSTLSEHSYTVDDPSTVEGYDIYNIDGYIYATQRCGAIPWFKLRNADMTDNIFTASAVERDNAASAGYVFERIEGYVLPSD